MQLTTLITFKDRDINKQINTKVIERKKAIRIDSNQNRLKDRQFF